MYLPIYFNDTQISKLPIYSTLSINRELMASHEIRADIDLPEVFVSPIGCYIILKGIRYTVNTPPLNAEKSGERHFRFSVVFESDLYRMYDKKLKHLNNKTFQYYGNLQTIAQLIIDNMNSIDSGWTVGVCDDVPEKTVDFDGHTCRTALDTTAEMFGVEWQLTGTGKELSFVKQVGVTTTHVFEYGRGKGLYSLAYQYQNDKNLVTRAFGYGSTRNLPENYRGGANQLMFDGECLEHNVELYRVKEGDYINEDIYPKVNGLVTGVSAFDADANKFTITDTTLDFNLKDYWSSSTAKISFLTGELQGQEFEILDYNHGTKTITVKVFTDGSNNKLPNTVFQAQVGDTYTLFDMFLPEEKVVAAELELKAKTQEWLNENSVPRVLYSLELDPLHARDNGIYLAPGDKVRVKEADLGINELIRVTKTQYPVNFPEVITPDTKIVCEIANFIPYTTTERVIADTIDNQKEIKIVDRTNAEKARISALNLRLLQSRVFNPDGSLFDGPESLVAGMAAFGYDSQNFNLNDVTISPNAGADENSMVISAGQLIHRIYKVDGLGYIWNMALNSWTSLDPAKFYYVYAKCSKNSLAGTWEISETPVLANDIVGYWAFNVGILYEVNVDGYRDFEFTKGMTYIVGDQITTGRIKDLTNQNYFDLTSGRFNMGDAETGIDWDVTTPATLTIRGALASKVIQVGSDGVVNAGISGVTDAGSSSIRFFAGGSNKSTAQYRVQDDGQVFATRVKLGYSYADADPNVPVTGWDINPEGIVSDPKGSNPDNFALMRGSGINKEFSFGTELIPASAGGTLSLTGRIKNNRVAAGSPLDPTRNIALSLEASGADSNIALDIAAGGIRASGLEGVTGELFYSHESVNYKLIIQNGLVVGNAPL